MVLEAGDQPDPGGNPGPALPSAAEVRIFWGSVLGFSEGWMQMLEVIFWDFGGMHVDPLGDFLGSFWEMCWHTLGDILGSSGSWTQILWLAAPGVLRSSWAIPPVPFEELGRQKPNLAGRRESEKTFLFCFPSQH